MTAKITTTQLRRLADSRVTMALVAVSAMPTPENEARYHEGLVQAAAYWRASMTPAQAKAELDAARTAYDAARSTSLLGTPDQLARDAAREEVASVDAELADLRYRAVCRDLGGCARRTLPHVYAGTATTGYEPW